MLSRHCLITGHLSIESHFHNASQVDAIVSLSHCGKHIHPLNHFFPGPQADAIESLSHNRKPIHRIPFSLPLKLMLSWHCLITGNLSIDSRFHWKITGNLVKESLFSSVLMFFFCSHGQTFNPLHFGYTFSTLLGLQIKGRGHQPFPNRMKYRWPKVSVRHPKKG